MRSLLVTQVSVNDEVQLALNKNGKIKVVHWTNEIQSVSSLIRVTAGKSELDSIFLNRSANGHVQPTYD